MCSFTHACVLPQDTRPMMGPDGKPVYDDNGQLVEETFCPRHEAIFSLFRKQAVIERPEPVVLRGGRFIVKPVSYVRPNRTGDRLRSHHAGSTANEHRQQCIYGDCVELSGAPDKYSKQTPLCDLHRAMYRRYRETCGNNERTWYAEVWAHRHAKLAALRAPKPKQSVSDAYLFDMGATDMMADNIAQAIEKLGGENGKA